jgi:hypothetical protein
MENHLTENELIEYQFKLASQEQQNTSSKHLEGCAECRQHLEKLNKKFASLDLLREDTHVSEELISQVMAQAKQPARQKVVPFYKSSWFGAVAAALVLVFVLLISNMNTKTSTKQQNAREPESEYLTVTKESGAKGQSETVLPPTTLTQNNKVKRNMPTAVTEPAQEEVTTKIVAKETLDLAAPVKGPARDIAALEATIAPTSKPIPEQPPFAPASAIELVTLPRRDNVQLTIYNSADLTLVRERRNLTLKKGWNWLQFMWANTLIDPTSLSLEPLEQVGKIDIQQLVFPARLRELGRWLIRSEISGQVPFEITYFTSGLSWRAFYMGTLSQDEKTMKMQGYVRIGNNSGEDYDNAQTRLIVGQVHLLDEIAQLAKRQYPYGRPVLGIESYGFLDERSASITNEPVTKEFYRQADVLSDLDRKEIRKEGLSEYFLYTIEGTETIPNEWGKRLLSFEAEDIAVESLYKYDEQRWGNHAIRFVKFANDEKHNLGQTPIPNGDVKIYSQADEQGSLSYVGGTAIKYIPVNEEVELNLGPARLVQIEPKLMDFKTENYIFNNSGNISGWDEIRTWKVEVTNTRTLPILIEITRGFDTAYWTLQSETPHEKHDATHARFTLELEPRSKQILEYSIRTYHGTREESLRQ